jgi:hypothetical protein
MIALSSLCISTTIHPERLLDAVRRGAPLVENKSWVSGERILRASQAVGEHVAVVLSDARDCSRLIAWGLVDSLRIGANRTEYTVTSIAPLVRHRRQELILESTGERIADGYIRPYAICQTPAFLKPAQLAKGRRVRLPAADAAVREGRRRLMNHLKIERNRSIVARFKDEQIRSHGGRLPCSVCGFDFRDAYGTVG